jgi:hypothetical protein
MSLAALIARHSNALTKACLGGGFFFGFAYTANNGTSPLRDFANAAGEYLCTHGRGSISLFSRALKYPKIDLLL